MNQYLIPLLIMKVITIEQAKEIKKRLATRLTQEPIEETWEVIKDLFD